MTTLGPTATPTQARLAAEKRARETRIAAAAIGPAAPAAKRERTWSALDAGAKRRETVFRRLDGDTFAEIADALGGCTPGAPQSVMRTLVESEVGTLSALALEWGRLEGLGPEDVAERLRVLGLPTQGVAALAAGGDGERRVDPTAKPARRPESDDRQPNDARPDPETAEPEATAGDREPEAGSAGEDDEKGAPPAAALVGTNGADAGGDDAGIPTRPEHEPSPSGGAVDDAGRVLSVVVVEPSAADVDRLRAFVADVTARGEMPVLSAPAYVDGAGVDIWWSFAEALVVYEDVPLDEPAKDRVIAAVKAGVPVLFRRVGG